MCNVQLHVTCTTINFYNKCICKERQWRILCYSKVSLPTHIFQYHRLKFFSLFLVITLLHYLISLWFMVVFNYYYMTWVCSRSNACSDRLILGHYSPLMPTGRLPACKSQAKILIIFNLLTLNVRSLRENLGPRPCRSLGQCGKVSVRDFPVKTSLSVNK